MYEFAQLAGFFAAHGVWSVSDGGPLIPMLAYEGADGQRQLTRFATEDLGAAAAAGRQAFDTNEPGAQRAALVVDGYITLESGRVDALIVDAIEYGPAPRSLTMAVPYRPTDSPAGFAVHRPKFLAIAGLPTERADDLGQAFFAGVDQHEQAAAVWTAHLDDSL